MEKQRCGWCCDNGINQKYHDEEWGVPVHDDRKQFEFLMLEVMQCGLSWSLMLKKREIFRKCFDNFEFEKVALYNEEKVLSILEEPGMIRSRRKIEAVIQNARQFLKIREEFGSFDKYLWAFSGDKTILYRRGKNACKEPAVRHGEQGFEKARFQISGFCYGVLPSAGLRHHQRPRGELFYVQAFDGRLSGGIQGAGG